MPTLRELIDHPDFRRFMEDLCEYARQSGRGFTDDWAHQMERQIAKSFPRQKIYSPAEPVRTADIAAATKTLPTDVVAKRMGVSRSWVCRVSKRRGNGQ